MANYYALELDNVLIYSKEDDGIIILGSVITDNIYLSEMYFKEIGVGLLQELLTGRVIDVNNLSSRGIECNKSALRKVSINNIHENLVSIREQGLIKNYLKVIKDVLVNSNYNKLLEERTLRLNKGN